MGNKKRYFIISAEVSKRAIRPKADRHAPKKSANQPYDQNADRYARKKSANHPYGQNADRHAPKKSAKQPPGSKC